MADLSPSRRRFQFRLRTLLIGVTLLCVAGGGYVLWQQKIVEERKMALADVAKSQGRFFVWGDGPAYSVNNRDKTIPLIRRLLADQPIYWIVYRHGATDDDIRRLKRLFPEAMIDDEAQLPSPGP
jgi:hypothetical protein